MSVGRLVRMNARDRAADTEERRRWREAQRQAAAIALLEVAEKFGTITPMNAMKASEYQNVRIEFHTNRLLRNR